MSSLQNQMSAFKSSVNAASTKIANKRTVVSTNSGTSTPTIKTETAASSNADLKRKRPEQNDVVYSQPADTGTGRNIMTQITYAVEHLKGKTTPMTLKDILSYLSLHHREEQYKKAIATILMKHEKIDYVRGTNGAESTFAFRPVHNIRSADSLLGHLQSQPTAQGLSARELRDGWPGAEAAIDELEAQGKLLATRNKKDNHAKMVWPDDPSLQFTIDEEFQVLWHKIKLPAPEALVAELEEKGLTPANKQAGGKKVIRSQEKKKKKPRKGGRTTNVHMAGVLRDYSHLKK